MGCKRKRSYKRKYKRAKVKRVKELDQVGKIGAGATGALITASMISSVANLT